MDLWRRVITHVRLRTLIATQQRDPTIPASPQVRGRLAYGRRAVHGESPAIAATRLRAGAIQRNGRKIILRCAASVGVQVRSP